MREVFVVLAEGELKKQLADLGAKHFRGLKLPGLAVVSGEEDGHGPAWLDAIGEVIYIDERVCTFRDKTTKILILHELIHWKLYSESKDPDENEGKKFYAELSRLKSEGAYTGLL
jgi:hypothetical protein